METALGEHLAAPTAGGPVVVYFSSVSGNTHKFVDKLDVEHLRIPVKTSEDTIVMDRPYVLCAPTYGRARSGAAVPPQVMKFLREPRNREFLLGVIGAGNTNFGDLFCIAADRIAAKCGVPVLYKFELMGTAEDVVRVNEGLREFWSHSFPR